MIITFVALKPEIIFFYSLLFKLLKTIVQQKITRPDCDLGQSHQYGLIAESQSC